MVHKKYFSFADLHENENIELSRAFETISHKDENTANNRLFVWNFEESDLEEFIQIFMSYKSEIPNAANRQNLTEKLRRKTNSMLTEGYNPIECMLYASKVINLRLQSDKELQEVLAGRIKDVYLKQEQETILVFENIIKMWTWIPQLKIIIAAIGLIGENEDLLDSILFYYAEDNLLKTSVFSAFMQNKTLPNLERAIKIIMNIGETNEDNALGKQFKKEITGFEVEGIKIINKYYNNPGVSRLGNKIFKNILLRMNNRVNANDDFYRNFLAKRSAKDDDAYKDFISNCIEKNDDKALYLCRFSRTEAGEYLKEILEKGGLTRKNKNTAIISIALLGERGYTHASEVVQRIEEEGDCEYAAMVAQIALGKENYAHKLANILSQKYDYELNELYSVLKDVNISNIPRSNNLVRNALFEKFKKLISESGESDELDAFCSNLQMFWDKMLFGLIPSELLTKINNTLKDYASGSLRIKSDIVISLIEVITKSYNTNVEATLFLLYQSSDMKIRELSFKKLKGRKLEPPK